VIWFETIRRFAENKLVMYNISFDGGIEHSILKIFGENKIAKYGEFTKKINIDRNLNTILYYYQ
jgi:hypothetical protein